MGVDAHDSDRRVGERMVDDEIHWIGEEVGEILIAYESERPDHRLRTFEDVERLWETVICPQLPNFKTMQQQHADRRPVPEWSVWYPNWHVPTERQNAE